MKVKNVKYFTKQRNWIKIGKFVDRWIKRLKNHFSDKKSNCKARLLPNLTCVATNSNKTKDKLESINNITYRLKGGK